MIPATKETRSAMACFVTVFIIVIFTTQEAWSSVTNFVTVVIVVIRTAKDPPGAMTNLFAFCIIVISTAEDARPHSFCVDKLQIELPFLQKGTVSQKHGTTTRLSILREPVITGGDTCYFLEKHTEALHIRIA